MHVTLRGARLEIFSYEIAEKARRGKKSHFFC
jgi:hypothetical protein